MSRVYTRQHVVTALCKYRRRYQLEHVLAIQHTHNTVYSLSLWLYFKQMKTSVKLQQTSYSYLDFHTTTHESKVKA